MGSDIILNQCFPEIGGKCSKWQSVKVLQQGHCVGFTKEENRFERRKKKRGGNLTFFKIHCLFLGPLHYSGIHKANNTYVRFSATR